MPTDTTPAIVDLAEALNPQPQRRRRRRPTTNSNTETPARTDRRSRAEHAMLIRAADQKTVESILEKCARHIDARQELDGEYEALVEEDLGVPASTARKFRLGADRPCNFARTARLLVNALRTEQIKR